MKNWLILFALALLASFLLPGCKDDAADSIFSGLTGPYGTAPHYANDDDDDGVNDDDDDGVNDDDDDGVNDDDDE